MKILLDGPQPASVTSMNDTGGEKSYDEPVGLEGCPEDSFEDLKQGKGSVHVSMHQEDFKPLAAAQRYIHPLCMHVCMHVCTGV